MSDKVKNRQNKNLGNVRTAPSLASWAVTIGLLGVAVGAVMPILEHGFGSHLYAYIYGAGALLSLAGRIFMRTPNSSLVLRRLYRIEIWSSIFFCAAAVFMYMRTAPRDWVALTLAGGMVMLYTSIRIPREIRKARKGGNSEFSNK